MFLRILYITGAGLFAVFAPSVLAVKGQKFFLLFSLVAGLLAAAVAAPSAFFNLARLFEQPGETIGGMLGALLGFGLPIWGTYAATRILVAFGASKRMQHLGAVITAALLIPIALPVAFMLTVYLTAL